jgi:hypothetical protein
MLHRLLRLPRADVEVGIAIPIGCLVPLAMFALLISAGVLLGMTLERDHAASVAPAPDQVVVRVVDDGAPGGPAVLATAVLPLR